ncbi:hypothetical protein K4L44_02120 [Halosquirtibacter laminarini]|uniref:Uncharacterized protein n=1 Tax=Halosquirtibacter laminarini TaxID=3374600 RepID=A0AC61NP93_9BACT|nr:hypothetical protein K4L44_02120 [Prolixibacteraceae bacterium]
MKTAIVDLGTNTCTLVIGSIQDEKLTISFKKSIPVILGSTDHYINGKITKLGIQKILNVLHTHHLTAQKYGIEQLNIFATAAIRESKNRDCVRESITANPCFKFIILNGQKEAEITTAATIHLSKELEGPILTMDIGGGSNEFVLLCNNKIVWSKSFKTGMARILNQFPFENNITSTNQKEILDYFESNHQELWDIIRHYKPRTLLGSSGAFDTFVDLVTYKKCVSHMQRINNINFQELKLLHDKLMKSSNNDRESMEGMEPIRATMIVYASILTQIVLDKSKIKNIYQTGYALAEGALYYYKYNS